MHKPILRRPILRRHALALSGGALAAPMIAAGIARAADNKAGSGGNVGTDAIAKSPPDGYTIGLYTIASQSIAPTLYAKLPFDVNKDFAAIAMMWSVPNMLMVRLDLPAKS